ncbi:MAG: UDP-N-acetylmuramate:L-alanyl-gamma-D-glutamyl-meso-diaminopimelate ligase [Mariprofundaceae bacterium]|nr:UDP-N-acetylmuramate:L-alanyl-gamma-D-glutamyl-meso-diaminopimelate ligase [Mariprofundaceae bacterium]
METSKKLHILGICGTAMAAIAGLAKEKGWHVSGSDAGVYPPMSDYLASLGIKIAPFSKDNLNTKPDLCVIGNAMSRGNVEVEAILSGGLAYCSGPEFVGNYILPNRHAVVVAGTHGKTTTASMMAHILDVADQSPGFLIGGMPENFEGGARLGEGDAFVLEGDEYDTAFFDKRSKFLHYHAKTLILNNLEYDHADIFPDLDAIQRQFSHLLRTVPNNGHIVVNADDKHLPDVLKSGCWTPISYFSEYKGAYTDTAWQWQALKKDGSAFCLYHQGIKVFEVSWCMIGIHNVSNACAVAAAAAMLGVSKAAIQKGFESFAGIRRRMSLVGEARGIRVFDDFAHHPTAIKGMVSAAKYAMKRDGKLWVIVEPRSNTMRSRIHQHRLPHCFEGADQIIFTPASDRGLKAGDVLDTSLLCTDIGAHAHVLADAARIIQEISEHAQAGDDVLILSNGDFDGIHQRLLETLRNGN